MKKHLSLAAVALLAATAQVSAQEYHGWKINASQALIDNDYNTALNKPVYDYNRKVSLQALYQAAYKPVTVNDDLTAWEHGTTTHTDSKGNFGDLTSNATTHTGTQHYHIDLALEQGLVEGAKLTSTMGENGLAYATIPAQYYKAGQLTDVPETGGDIRIRFYMLAGDKGRINDADMPHLDDITGVHMTVDAPSTVKVSAHFTQASNTAFTAGTDATANDKLGKMGRVAIFNLPATKGQGLENISTTDKPTNSYNLFSYKRSSDTYGFPIYAVDIVFQGVKPGEQVGWTNFQTLHDGYTANIYTGVRDIIAPAEAEAPAQYYTIQGYPVATPAPGQIYIKRQGTTYTKVRL